MITIIDSLNKQKYPHILSQMHRLRARVFEGRLGWDVTVKNGEERDRFDELDPAHVVCLNEKAEVVGCMRMLQTTGPHMLADVFSSILNDEPPLRSAKLWEATRFCVDTERLDVGRGPNSISSVTSEVMIASLEYAMEAGVEDAIAVIDPVMNRVLKRSGNGPYDYVGTPKQMGKVVAMAGLLDCTDERLESVRGYSGIRYDVFMTTPQVDSVEASMKAKAEAGSAVRTGGIVIQFPVKKQAAAPSIDTLRRQVDAIRHPDLRSYCLEQIETAHERHSFMATAKLVEEVVRSQA